MGEGYHIFSLSELQVFVAVCIYVFPHSLCCLRELFMGGCLIMAYDIAKAFNDSLWHQISLGKYTQTHNTSTSTPFQVNKFRSILITGEGVVKM